MFLSSTLQINAKYTGLYGIGWKKWGKQPQCVVVLESSTIVCWIFCFFMCFPVTECMHLVYAFCIHF